MESLADRKCKPCEEGGSPLPEEQSMELLLELNGGWKLIDNHHLSKTFAFPEFKDAVSWVNKVADLAERVNHHPNIEIDYNKVRLSIWTHKLDGLSEADFVLAAKTDVVK